MIVQGKILTLLVQVLLFRNMSHFLSFEVVAFSFMFVLFMGKERSTRYCSTIVSLCTSKQIFKYFMKNKVRQQKI